MVLAVFPGVFDPMTLAHLDIIKRISVLFDDVIVAVAVDPAHKKPTLTIEDRLNIISAEIVSLGNVRVRAFTGLLVDFLQQNNASFIIRGIRPSVADFEYEYRLAVINGKIGNNTETLLMPGSEKYQFISSDFVKELIKLNGDVSEFLTSYAYKRIYEVMNK